MAVQFMLRFLLIANCSRLVVVRCITINLPPKWIKLWNNIQLKGNSEIRSNPGVRLINWPGVGFYALSSIETSISQSSLIDRGGCPRNSIEPAMFESISEGNPRCSPPGHDWTNPNRSLIVQQFSHYSRLTRQSISGFAQGTEENNQHNYCPL